MGAERAPAAPPYSVALPAIGAGPRYGGFVQASVNRSKPP